MGRYDPSNVNSLKAGLTSHAHSPTPAMGPQAGHVLWGSPELEWAQQHAPPESTLRLPPCAGLGAWGARFSQGEGLPEGPQQGSPEAQHPGFSRGHCSPDHMPLATTPPGQAHERQGWGGGVQHREPAWRLPVMVDRRPGWAAGPPGRHVSAQTQQGGGHSLAPTALACHSPGPSQGQGSPETPVKAMEVCK